MEFVDHISALNTRDTSRALPLCGIAGFFLASRGSLTFLFFQSNPRTGSVVTTALTISYAFLVLGYSILNPPSHAVPMVRPQPLKWILLYLALAGASLVWTASNAVLVAASYWLAIAADVFGIWLLLRYGSAHENAVRVMQGFVLGAALVALVAWAAPAMEDGRLGNEDFLHPNFIGFELAIAVLFAAYLAQQQRAWAWMSGALFITTLRTLSKASIVGLLVAGSYYVIRGLQISSKARLFITSTCAAIILGFWGLLEAYLDVYTQGNNLETLTGRTYIWSNTLDMIPDRPWIGHGFDSFRWLFPPFNGFQPWQAHNEWLQQLFTYGVVGLLLSVGVYVSFYRAIKASRNIGLKSLATALLVLVLVRSLVDTDRFELCFPLWLMTMFAMALHSDSPPQASA